MSKLHIYTPAGCKLVQLRGLQNHKAAASKHEFRYMLLITTKALFRLKMLEKFGIVAFRLYLVINVQL
jgi:hypothetical protein